MDGSPDLDPIQWVNWVEDKLRRIAREFLERPDAICFIGYEAGLHGFVRPAFIRNPEGVSRLVWNQACFPNLATYIPEFRFKKGVVGIAVKGCDARALRELIRARQIDRSGIFIVGLPCTGLKVTGQDRIAERCYGCVFPEDFHYDAVLGPMRTPDLPERSDVEPLTSLPLEKRQAFWQAELDKCIRCDACKNICYGCFCPECILESTQPRWLSRHQGQAEKFLFHSIRALHLAGRCIGCGECERACPAGVRLMLLNRYMQKEMKDLFGYKGVGVGEEDPPLLTYSREDADHLTGSFS